ncbi:efflux RND transporter permease subunit [Streptomyces sp. NPDC057638]|uniref:efflux RND transporter permease subunit n=1 Tax=Streptomyces sp. NPDC057638 TaxID=3346190 RepID=UPI0036B61DBA
MTWLSKFSLSQRALIGMMSIITLIFGAIAIPQLKQQLLPTLELPMVSVLAPYEGASPDVVEKQVVEPLETSLESVDGITGVTSTASEGNAVVLASFDYGEGVKQLVSDVQEAVNRARAELPDGVDPQVVAGSTDDIPTVVLAVTSGRESQQALAAQLKRTIVPELEGIDGVNQVSVDGVRELQVSVTPDERALAAAGLTGPALADALRAGGSAVPAGSFSEAGQSRTVQVGGGFTTLRQIEELRIPAPPGGTGGAVRLGDVATVKEAPAAATSLTRTNGKPSLAVLATMDNDGSAVSISRAVEEKLPELRRDLGADAEVTVVSDQGPAVEKSISGLTTEGALGLLFAVVVILVFLASLRSTLVTAVSIPLSVVLALLVLWSRDLSLNILTLGALTIAIGRVVDDSIVVLENIKRHLGYGEERHSAIVTAVKEVAGAVTSSTLTTVAVFLPIGLVGGAVGQLFGSFSLTVTAALLASLLVSLTVVPVLSYWFLHPPKEVRGLAPEEARRIAEEKEERSPLQRFYVRVLRFATRRRLTSVLLAVAVLVVSLGLAGLLKTNFFDQGEQKVMTIKQELPAGGSLAATDAAARQVEKVLAGVSEIKDYQVTVGSSGFAAAFGGAGANEASYQITLTDSADFDDTRDRLDDELARLKGIGDTTISGGDGFGAQDLSVVVKAADPAILRTASEAVREEVAGLDGVTDVQSDLAQSVPRISVTATPRTADAGFTEAGLGAAVTQAVRGLPAAKAIIDDTERDVVITSARPATTLAQLRNLPLGGATLGRIADVRLVPGPVSMSRIDGSRAATITAKPLDDNTGDLSTGLQKAVDGLDLPRGATASIGGVTEDQKEAFASLALAMLAAVAIVFMLLVATFRSLVQPLILLVSIPFASTGAIGLLILTDTALGVPALIGMLMLIGIVVTNAIVLIDLINQYRAQGLGVIESVIEGGRHRLRPILMTALATIFALLPMALGITGEGGFIAKPLAVVVIGGLISSTLLTLLLVPTLYAMVELRKERRAAKRAAKRGTGDGGHAGDDGDGIGDGRVGRQSAGPDQTSTVGG